MKREILILATFATASCSSLSIDDGKDIVTGVHTVFNVDIEEVEIADGLHTDNRWKDGACLGVFGSESGENELYCIKRDDVGKVQAVFYGSAVKGEEILACCPVKPGMKLEGGLMPCELPTLQPFGGDALECFLNASECAFARLEEGRLHFRYPFGILEVQFRFDQSLDLTALQLSSVRKISGRMAAGGDAVLKTLDISSDFIDLDLGGETVPTIRNGKYTSFFFVLPPGFYAAGELTVAAVSESESFEVILKGIEVPRVSMDSFHIASTVVETAQLLGFDKEDGILE